MVTTGAPLVEVTPVPDKLTVCTLPATPLLLSIIVIAPLLVPVAVGVKVTLIVQEPPTAIAALKQLLVSLKGGAMPMPVIVSAAFPVLLNVTDCDALVIFSV